MTTAIPFRSISFPVHMSAESRASHCPVVWGYRVLYRLGSGPLGAVYAAEDVETGQRVAFRGFTKPRGMRQIPWRATLNRFVETLVDQSVADSHPGIQSVLRFGEERGIFFVVTECFEGRNLQQMLLDEGAMSVADALSLFAQLADAVDYAASLGIGHGDLTPFNVVVTRQGNLRVQNFGLAHARLTTGSAFSAPEQTGGKAGDYRSDIFAAGALLYTMLSGKQPFSGRTPEAMERSIQRNRPALLVDQSPVVRAVLQKLMATDPRDRYAKLADAVTDLSVRRAPLAAPVHEAPVEPIAPWEVGQESAMSYPSPFEGGAVARGRSSSAPKINQCGIARQDVLRLTHVGYALKATAKGLWRTAKPVAAIAASVVVLGGLGLHAMKARIVYDYANVAALQGCPTVSTNGIVKPLAAGDQIDGQHVSVIATNAKSSVVLSLQGSRMKIMPSSRIAIDTLGYHNGADREFRLLSGSVIQTVDPRHRTTARFVTRAGNAVVKVKGTEFEVSIDDREDVTVTTFHGNVAVAGAGTDYHVLTGESLRLYGKDCITSGVERCDPGMKAIFASQTDLLAAPSPLEQLDTAFAVFEDQFVLRIIDEVHSALHAASSDGAKDAKALEAAQTSAHALNALIASSGTDLPDTIDPSTLQPLGATPKEASRILAEFDGQRLQSYRRIDADSYEFTVRANDTAHTLLHGHDGAVDVAGASN